MRTFPAVSRLLDLACTFGDVVRTLDYPKLPPPELKATENYISEHFLGFFINCRAGENWKKDRNKLCCIQSFAT